MESIIKTVCAVVIVPLLLSACASRPFDASQTQINHLLSGELLFATEVEAAQAEDVFTLSDEMRQWVHTHAGSHPYARTRLRQLLQAMLDDGLLNLDYDLSRSQTARQTFTTQVGNCLSFSILFVALARELDLQTQFQIVDIPPSFSNADALVMLNNHINVRVNGIRRDVRHTQDHIVDFNSAEYNGNYSTRRVSDAYARSLYHGNVAVELMGRTHYRAAFKHLKRALTDSPKIAGMWINLGVLYARMNQFEHAEAAYKIALQADPYHKSALVNLVAATKAQGKLEESADYARRVQKYVRANPYYYQQHAKQALMDGRSSEALEFLNRAISIKDDEHQFYHLQGIAHIRAGNVAAAKRSLRTAQEVAHRADLQDIYARKLSKIPEPT